MMPCPSPQKLFEVVAEHRRVRPGPSSAQAVRGAYGLGETRLLNRRSGGPLGELAGRRAVIVRMAGAASIDPTCWYARSRTGPRLLLASWRSARRNRDRLCPEGAVPPRGGNRCAFRGAYASPPAIGRDRLAGQVPLGRLAPRWNPASWGADGWTVGRSAVSRHGVFIRVAATFPSGSFENRAEPFRAAARAVRWGGPVTPTPGRSGFGRPARPAPIHSTVRSASPPGTRPGVVWTFPSRSPSGRAPPAGRGAG